MIPYFRTLVLSTFCLLASCLLLHADISSDAVVDLQATVSDTSPRITLSWTQHLQSNITAQVLYRRLKGATGWGTALATLTTTQTSYADTTALPNVEYEYWMKRSFNASPYTAIGYLSAGDKVPEVQTRGTLLLVVDDTMVTPLAGDISQLRDDLTSDGWNVQQITAPRSGTAISTKALIKAAYLADPTNVKMVYLLGRVPVPYTGFFGPDGHGSRALPSDGYYGDMDDSLWTDVQTFGASITGTRGNNVPGDGKFDQSYYPSTLELEVGRVDMFNMVSAPSSVTTETTLLRRYLSRAHDFRFKQGAYAAIPRRSLMREGFIDWAEAFAAGAWATAYTSVSPSTTVPAAIDQAPSDQWFTYATANSYLTGHIDGSGGVNSFQNGGIDIEFGRKACKVVFPSAFGSFSEDWDQQNAAMRCLLAGNATGDSLALTCYWDGRPHYFTHQLGMGETYGYAVRTTQNAYFTYDYTNYTYDYTPQGSGFGQAHVGLLGDPALRLHIVEPPRNLTATSANSQVTLAWTASGETALQGYDVYRAATSAGPFTKLTGTTQAGTSYIDSTGTAGNSYVYLVRTLKLENPPGGSYYNHSHGSLVTLTVNGSATATPLNATNLAVVQASSQSATLTWTDNSSNETGFRIERMTSTSGTFASIGTVGASVTTFTDPGSFTAGTAYYYRVIATGTAGDSAASPVASFEASAGTLDFQTVTLKKVSRAAGTAVIPVERFGGVTGAASVTYTTTDSSAVSGVHYTGGTGTVSWADGESGVKNITIPLINNGTPWLPRQFRITLSNPIGAGLSAYNTMAVLIEDPTATLPSPWNQAAIQELYGTLSDTSPAVQAEGVIGSAMVGGIGLDNNTQYWEGGQFIYQSWTGDGVLTSYLPNPIPVQTAAYYAVMVRDTNDSKSEMAATVVSGDPAQGSRFIYRLTYNTSSFLSPVATNSLTGSCWIRIIRVGNLFTSQRSTDGTTWSTFGSASVPLLATTSWGLFHISTGLDFNRQPFGDYQLATFQNVTLANLPAADTPTGLGAAAVTSTSVPLTWVISPFAAGYRIERLSEDGTLVQITDIASGTTSYIDSTIQPDTAYKYRISAYNSLGQSVASAFVGVVTPPSGVVTKPLRPGFLTITQGTGSNLNLAWLDGSSNETGFRIERRVANGSWALLTTCAANTTSYTDTSAQAGVMYEYRVCATSAAGNTSWANVISLASTPDVTVNNPVWSPDSILFNQDTTAPGNGYVPTGLTYSSIASALPFVTGQSLSSSLRSSAGWYGMKINVGANSILVSHLSRWVISGNSGTHTVKLVNAATGVDVPGGSCSIATSGAAVGFKYVALASPVTLAANSSYYLVSQEVNSGDQYYELNNALTVNTGIATAIPVETTDNVHWYTYSFPNNSYGPVSFQYEPTIPFTTRNGMTALRNNYTGWMGMKVTIGANSILASQLGRWVAPGNTGTHTVKLVNAVTGLDVPGGSVSVATSGATSGQIKYGTLATTITLTANTSYYLLSQETTGGDQWYDYNIPAGGTATGYQTWLLGNGLPMDASGGGSATATPANDGLSNLMKYSLGLTSSTSGNGGHLSYGQASASGSNYLSLTYIRPNPTPSDITYIVETSPDLSLGSWTTSGVVLVSNTANGSSSTVTMRNSTPLVGGNKGFMRLKVTQP